MTLWLKGRNFFQDLRQAGKSIDSCAVTEIMGGKYHLGACRSGINGYYQISWWEGSKVIMGQSKLATTAKVYGDVSFFKSERDEYPQVYFGGIGWYVKPEMLEEIKEENPP